MNLNKKWLIIWLVLIIAIGVFLRLYHFSDWLHFELDQARDALVIKDAIKDGSQELPLLGPRARGTLLRSGPVFYYFEYASALIFGNTPPGIAYSVLFFSILTLPLFYLYCRRYFEWKMSLTLLFLFSISAYLVVYSRFAWNPNLLPFFVILFLYSLHRAFDAEEKRGGLWLIAGALALAIGTQMHILAAISMPLCSLAYIIYKRPRIKWKFWLASLFVILLFYSPLIINEILTGGKNTEEFTKAMQGESGQMGASFAKKIMSNCLEYSDGLFIVLTGRSSDEVLGETFKPATVDWKNDKMVGQYVVSRIFSILLLISATLIIILSGLINKKNRSRKDFLWLNTFWLTITFFLFVPFVFDLSPRFFLLAAPLPFILLGLIFEKTGRFLGKNSWILGLIIVSLVFFSNAEAIWVRYLGLSKATIQRTGYEADRILKEDVPVTYSQEIMIVDYMQSFSDKNGFPVFYAGIPDYEPAFEYILKQRNISESAMSKKSVYKEGNYFYINKTSPHSEWDLGDFSPKYDVIGKKEFGTLTVLALEPKPGAITAVAKEFENADKEKRSKAPRYNWSKLFSR